MSTKLSQKLERINASVARIREKTNLPNAVIEDVATAIETLEVPTGSIAIVENGTVDVTNYAQAEVNVPGLVPAGSITITENGSVDVTNYAEAIVDVASGSGGEITKTNIYKVSSIGERDAIADMVEGDLCVIHYNAKVNMDSSAVVSEITFPATVVLPSAFSGSTGTTLQSDDYSFMIDLSLTASRMRATIMGDDYITLRCDNGLICHFSNLVNINVKLLDVINKDYALANFIDYFIFFIIYF